MKGQGVPINYKINNVALVNRYKVRQMKTFNINLKPVICEEAVNYRFEQNYSPFTINSRRLPEYRKETVLLQPKSMDERSHKSIGSQDTRRHMASNKSQTRMPSIMQSSSKTQSLLIQKQMLFTNNNKQNPQQQKMIKPNPRPFHSQNKVKRCSCGKCQQCMKDFAYYLHLCSDQRGVPEISAKSWCIWRQKDDKFYYYYGKRIHKVRQIASLTKIITAMVLIDYAQKYAFDLTKTLFAVRKSSALIGGTTAKLLVGEVYTLKELLYGMMLPSGNDAAIAISEAVSLMINLKQKNKPFDPHTDTWFVDYQNKTYSYLFINAMNEKVQRLGAIDTKFYNSHGNDAFDQLKNISTCNQIAKISGQFMKYPLLREVAKTHQFTFRNGNKVENTNKLLEDGFQGIKTGITQTAGPCLAACYKDLVVVVLNSKSMNERWFEVKKLVKWIKNKL